jgi:hypothetical protein
VGYDPASCTDIVVHRFHDPAQTVCAYTEFTRLWGYAYVDTGVVVFAGADVWLNDACTTVRVMRRWVLTHELGHAVGMIHNLAPDSVLSPAYDVETYRGRPGPSDVTTLAALYAR